MQKFVYLFVAISVILISSCKKEEPQPSSNSSSVAANSIIGDWNWYETVQVVRDANGNVVQPNGITPMAYTWSAYVHSFSSGIYSVYISGAPQFESEIGFYDNQTITEGTGGANSKVYEIVSLTSNELVMEYLIGYDGTTWHYERTTLQR